MPRIPKRRRRVTPSGRVGGVPMPMDIADTGAGLKAKGLGALGQGVGNLGQALFKIEEAEGISQASTARGLAEAEMRLLEERLRDNNDPTTYQAALVEALGRTNEFRPKNPIGAKMFDDYLERATPGWESGVGILKIRKQQSLIEGAYIADRAQAITNGDLDEANRLTIEARDKTGAITPQQAAKDLASAPSLVIRSRVTSLLNLANKLSVAGEWGNANIAIEQAQTLLDTVTDLDAETEKLLRGRIQTSRRVIEQKEKEQLKQLQENTAKKMLLSLWDETLTDDDLRRATESNLLTYERAKGLRNALANPKTFNLSSYIKVKNAVNSYERGSAGFDDALDVLMANARLLGDQGKGLTDKLFAIPNKNEADWEKEALDYIENQILEKDIFGRFYGTPKEQAAALEARLAYDVALEEAERKGEPIEGRDKLIKAHEIMLKYRPEKEEKPPVELEKGLGTIPFVDNADIDSAIKQAKENLGEKATPQEIKAEVLRLLK